MAGFGGNPNQPDGTQGTASVKLTRKLKDEGKVEIITVKGCIVEKNSLAKLEQSLHSKGALPPANYFVYIPNIEDISKDIIDINIDYYKYSNEKEKKCNVKFPVDKKVVKIDFNHIFLPCESHDCNKSKFLEEKSKSIIGRILSLNQTVEEAKVYGLTTENNKLKFTSFQIKSVGKRFCVDDDVFRRLECSGPLLLADNQSVVGCYKKIDDTIIVSTFGYEEKEVVYRASQLNKLSSASTNDTAFEQTFENLSTNTQPTNRNSLTNAQPTNAQPTNGNLSSTFQPTNGNSSNSSLSNITPGQFPTAVSSIAPNQFPTSTSSIAPGQVPTAVNSITPGQFPTSTSSITPGQFPISISIITPGQFPTAVNSITPGQFPTSTSSIAPNQFPTSTSIIAPDQFPTSTSSITPGQFPIQEQTRPTEDYTDNIEASTNHQKLTLKALLPEGSDLAVKLSQMLNRENNRAIRNWKHLAHNLHVPPDVCLSFANNSQHSPTQDLFDHLQSWKRALTFSELKTKLRSIYRNDLIQILEKEGCSDLLVVADKMEVADLLQEKLDVPSRNMDWKALARKFNIPKNTFEQFGKPKLGPTSQLFLHVRLTTSFDELKVKSLKEYLETMERFDVIRVFEQHPDILDNALVKDKITSDSQILEDLSILLDREIRAIKGWKNLAFRLGIPNHIYEDFDTSEGNNKNPTLLLLKWLANNSPEFKVIQLIESLQKINRNDVVEELRNGMDVFAQEQLLRKQEKKKEVRIETDRVASSGSADFVSKCNSKMMHSVNTATLNSEQRLGLKVVQIPNKLYEKLCNMLDVEDPFFNDFRTFAEELGVENDKIRLMGQQDKPTHSLLLEYQLNVVAFMKIMKKISREDVISVLTSWVNNVPTADSADTKTDAEKQEKL